MPEDIDEILETESPTIDRNLKPQRTPLTSRTIIGQALAGVLAGAVGAPAGLYAGHVVHVRGLTNHEAGIWVMFSGAYIGYALVSPIGVYIAGRIGNRRGSFWATFGSSILVAAVGWYTFPPAVFLGTICAALAFNRTARHKSPPAS